MFEALPVVIPTLRDVARGTLRSAEPEDAAEATDTRTAAILLDTRAASMPALYALYDELELYLQAGHISTLRLHRRGRSTVAQMLDILAGVTLLRSRGCRRVILIVAADGAIPRWEQSRAETLAGMLDVIRRHHGSTAHELIDSIEGLVKTIRIVADSVVGVATIFAAASELPAAQRSSAMKSSWRARGAAASASRQQEARSPQAIALSLARAGDHVDAVSRLYLWCRSLARQAPAAQPEQHSAPALDVVVAQETLALSTVLTEVRDAGEQFHRSLEWLDGQWDALVGGLARETPGSAARVLAAGALVTAEHPRSKALAASRATWEYLDGPSRLKWLEICCPVFASLLAPMMPLLLAN